MGRYLLTAYDGVTRHCTACGTRKVIYQVEESGELLTCCCTCQRILEPTRREEAEPAQTQVLERPVQQGEVRWP